MILSNKNIPFGTLPYETIDSVTRMQAKLFDKNPFLPFLPKIVEDDDIVKRTFSAIPGVKFNGKKIYLKIGSSEYKQSLEKLDKAYNKASKVTLEPYAIESPFFEKFLDLIKKFQSPNATINLLGPFTISQMLMNAAEEQVLADKSFRKLFIQAVAVKALWAIEKIKEVSPKTVPIIVLEEPLYGQFGMIKRANEEVTPELVTSVFAKVIERIKQAGALVAIHCKDKCDWKIPINAGVDIISFDAYNNPNNLCIIPENIEEFINRGGVINWAVVPVMTEALVKSLNLDFVTNRLVGSLEGLVIAGVPRELVYKSAVVSVQGDTEHLPLIFAEKALILSSQLSKKIPIKS